MNQNLLYVILVAVLWISVACSSGETRTTTSLLPQAKESTPIIGSTKVTRPQVNPNLLLKQRVLALFQQEKFSALDALLESFQNDFEKDFRKEMVLEETFSAFWAYDPAMESRLHKWVQQSPQSYSALLARASYFQSRAQASARAWVRRSGAGFSFVHARSVSMLRDLLTPCFLKVWL